MREAPSRFYLKVLEEYRAKTLHFSRSAMATEMGIPVGTYTSWCGSRGTRRKPSPKYVRWIKSFLECRGLLSAESWMRDRGPKLLSMVGFGEGQAVVDFGSGRGDYTLMLAGLVGKKGRVYAVDKDRSVLGELMGKARCKGLTNIRDKFVPGSKARPPTKVPLPRGSIDGIWFSDVLHDGYFEKDEQKEELLRNLRAALKVDGFIAVHAVHMEERRLKKVIRLAGFELDREFRRVVLFHGSEFHRSSIFRYRNTGG